MLKPRALVIMRAPGDNENRGNDRRPFSCRSIFLARPYRRRRRRRRRRATRPRGTSRGTRKGFTLKKRKLGNASERSLDLDHV